MRYLPWIILFIIISPFCALGQKTFEKKTYYDDQKTKLKEVITLLKKDSTLHGFYHSIYENGSLAIFGHYSHGESDSTWIYYFENGREKARGHYQKNQQVGLWKYHYENGEPKAVGSYQNNIKHGQWTYYFENGEEKSTGIYYNNDKEGIWNYFYEDGSLKAQAFFNGGKGIYKEFYPSGKLKTEGRNEFDKSEGLWTYYYESGEVEARGEFVNGLRNGLWKYFHKHGQLAAEGEFLKGEKSGPWKYYFPDGSLSSEGEMNSNQKDGFWKLYYQTGEIKGEGRYDQGTGEYIEYYASGKQKARGAMQEGRREGRWVYFSEEGLEDGAAVFEQGEGAYTGYYPDGSLKMTGTIKDDRRVGEWTLYNPDGSVAGIYRPVYEEQSPIFRTSNVKESEDVKKASDKPEYRYKNKKIRYFNPRINEYTGFILGTNPLWTLAGQLPISMEYYIQERLGYEAQIVAHKKPFYKDFSDRYNKVSTLGLDIHLKQKFYHEDTDLGMFYFGHQLSAGYLQHYVSTLDSLSGPPIKKRFTSEQMRFAYGFFIGDRWMQRASDSGLTFDLNLGVALGSRIFSNHAEAPFRFLFDELNQDKFYLPIIITLNIGYAGPKRRSTSF